MDTSVQCLSERLLVHYSAKLQEPKSDYLVQ